MKGIDVSKWQGDINWSAVKESGIEFAIVKAGGSDSGFYKDPKFEQNYAGATEVGLHVGAYYIVGSGCISYNDGVADANRFINIIKDKKFSFPVYIDLELTSTENKAGATQACIGFCKTMEDAGYFAGIYASDIYGFKDRLNANLLTDYAKWVARYGTKPSYITEYGIWQSSETGRVNGINGDVDLDESFVDYPYLIKLYGLNGFEIPEEAVEEPAIDWETKYNELKEKFDRIIAIINE